MKKTKNYLLHALSIPFFAALVASGAFSCNDAETKGNYSIKNDVNAFHVGDTLYPDYSHNDTLIVVSIASADTLNLLFDGVGLPVPATDWEIDSVLRCGFMQVGFQGSNF